MDLDGAKINIKRAEKVTVEQKEILVEFMFDHIDLARGKWLGPEGKITNGNLWQILCQQLNAVGPEKNIVQWQRVWKDIKMNVKKKASALAGGRMKTGGGPPDDIGLTDMEEKILTIMSKISVFGVTGPDGVPLDSAEPMMQSEEIARPNATLKSSISWVDLTERTEENVVQQNICTEGAQLISPACSSQTESSDGEISVTPLRKRNQKPESVQAAKDFKDLGRETVEAIKDLKLELSNLTNKIKVLCEQNERMLNERVNTNQILFRLAVALEGQYLNE